MQIKTFSLCVAGLVALSGCRVEDPTVLSPSNFIGVGSDALIVEGTVRVFALNGEETMARTITDNQGRYEITDFMAPAGMYKVRLEGGYYIEEASGTRVTLQDGQFLEALVQHEPGEPINAMLTPATTLSSALAQYKMDQGQSETVAVSSASSEISGIYGVDILGTWPANITDPNNASFAMNSELEYGFVQAGRSELVREINQINGFTGHEQYTSIQLGMLGFMDMRYDGRLDGIGRASASDAPRKLSMGTYQLSTDTYRADHAKAIIRAAGEDYNRVKIPATDLVLGAERLATSIEPVFGNLTPGVFDDKGPELTWDLSEGQSHNLTTTVTATATDFVGVNSVNLYVNDTFIAEAADTDNLTFDINTLNIPEGPVTFKLEAFDNVGNRSELAIGQVVDNTGPVINLTSPLLSNSTTYRMEGTVSDAYNQVVSLTVNGQEANIDGDTWSLRVPTPEGVNPYVIVATDSVGEKTTLSRDILIDTVVPTLVAFPSTGTFVNMNNGETQVLSLDQGSNSQALRLNQNNFTLGSLSLDRTALDSAGIAYFGFEVDDGESDNRTAKADLTVQYRALISGGVVRDWSSVPLVGETYLLPLTVEYLSEYLEMAQRDDEVRVEVRVRDEATNKATFTWSSAMDLVLHRITYYTDNLDRNQLFSYRYIGATGGMVNFCPVNEDRCEINFAADVSNIQSIMDGVRYVEPYNDRSVTSRDRIVGYTNFAGTEMNQYFSPLSSLFAGYFESDYVEAEDFFAAYNSAKASVVADLDLNPMEVGIVDPTKSPTLTPEAKHGLLLEALSAAAYEIDGRFSDEVNSVSLAWASYRDLRDGVEDALENGIVTKISGAQIGHRDVVDRLGKGVITAAEAMELDYIEDVVDFAGEIYTPQMPTIDLGIGIDDVAGNLTVAPITTSDTQLDYKLTINGSSVGGNNSSWTVNTANFADGPASVSVTITDRFGQQATASKTILFDNTAPALDLQSSILVSESVYSFDMDIEDAHSDLESVTFNGQSVVSNGRSASIRAPLGLSSDVTVLPVIATDTLGNTVTENINVVRMDSVYGNYLSGKVELFDTTPSNDSGVSIDVTLGTNSLAGPGAGLVWSLDTENFADTTLPLTVVVNNAYGHSATLSGNVIIDNMAPQVTFTSAALVGEPGYTLTMEVVDPGDASGLKTVMVDGSESGLSQTGDTFSKIVTITGATQDFQVEVRDFAGNVATSTYTVAKDVIDPTLTITQSAARVWNNNTQSIEYVSDLDNAFANDLKLHHFYNDFDLGYITTERTVDSGFDQHWIKLTVADEGSDTSYFTNLKDLDVEYRYTINGTELVNWTPATKRMDDEYYVTLGTKMLTAAFQLSRQDLDHRIEVRVTDEIGRTQTRFVDFGVVVQVSQSGATRAVNSTTYDWQQHTFQSLETDLEGTTLSDTTALYLNDTSSPVWVNVSTQDTTAYTVNGRRMRKKHSGQWINNTKWYYFGCDEGGYCTDKVITPGTYWTADTLQNVEFSRFGDSGWTENMAAFNKSSADMYFVDGTVKQVTVQNSESTDSPIEINQYSSMGTQTLEDTYKKRYGVLPVWYYSTKDRDDNWTTTVGYGDLLKYDPRNTPSWYSTRTYIPQSKNHSLIHRHEYSVIDGVDMGERPGDIDYHKTWCDANPVYCSNYQDHGQEIAWTKWGKIKKRTWVVLDRRDIIEPTSKEFPVSSDVVVTGYSQVEQVNGVNYYLVEPDQFLEVTRNLNVGNISLDNTAASMTYNGWDYEDNNVKASGNFSIIFDITIDNARDRKNIGVLPSTEESVSESRSFTMTR